MRTLLVSMIACCATLSAAASAQTPALNRAAQTVRTEVNSWGSGTGLAPEYLYALSTMNYVQSRLSSANYAALMAGSNPPASLDAEQCLTLEAGLCGSHVDTFDKVLAACAFPVRRRAVEWYLHDEKARNNRNHVAAEVFYASRWHLFDVTSCTIVPAEHAKAQDDLLGAEELMAAAKRDGAWRPRILSNAAAVWNRQAQSGHYDAMEQFKWPDVDVLYARSGTIHLRPDREGATYDLSN